MRSESYRIRRNNANLGVKPFKVIQCHEFGTNRKHICDFLLVINSNFPPTLHRFRDIAFDRSKVAIFGCLSCVYPPDGWVALGRSPYNFSCFSTDGQDTKMHRHITENFNLLSTVHERYRQTDRRQTGRFTTTSNVNVNSRLLKIRRKNQTPLNFLEFPPKF